MVANVSKAVCITYNPQTQHRDRSSLVITQLQTYHTQNGIQIVWLCTNVCLYSVTLLRCVYVYVVVSQGQLYLLVTDQGFLTEEKVVWESLHNVDGDGNFCDSEFRLRPPSDPETVYRGQQDQIDQV